MAALAAQPARDLEPVDVGHHHVEHEQVGLPVAGQGESLLAATGRAHVEAHELQAGREQVGDVVLVVDHEHAGLGVSCTSVHDHQGTVRRWQLPGSLLTAGGEPAGWQVRAC